LRRVRYPPICMLVVIDKQVRQDVPADRCVAALAAGAVRF
jgi:hypothetical protein